MRKNVKKVKLKNIEFGNGRIYIQSMLNCIFSDVKSNVDQAIELENAGCEILRVSIPNTESLKLIPAIKDKISIPLVADIHFNYKLALEAIKLGIDKIRINPGNIGSDENVKIVADACKSKNIPIRIGVNSGSVEKNILSKYGSATSEALVESALYHVNLLEKFNFNDIIISIKSSNVEKMVKAYRILAQKCNYPLHLGVTEAGTERMGIIKSAVGIGSLLLDNIGDTIRVSLTADPIKEIEAANDILHAIGRSSTPAIEFVCCPTCGRTQIDLIPLANQVQERLKNCKKNIKVAIMGCIVNGPGEASDADIGIAGGNGFGFLFKKGNVVKKVPESDLVDTLVKEVESL